MRPVTFIVPDLGHSSHAKQVSLLAAALKETGRPVSVFSLAGTGPFAEPVRAAGIQIEGRHARRPWDLGDWFRLRQRVRETREGALHVFGPSALRRLHFATLGMPLPPIVLTLTGRELLGWLDVWLANRVMRVVVPHRFAAETVIRQGVPGDRVSIVAPGVGDATPPVNRESFASERGFAPNTPLLVTAGNMNRRDDLFGALWSFEFLRYIETNSRLLVVGGGPARAAMEFAAEGLAPEGSRVAFLGPRADVPAVLGLADVVLVPQLSGGIDVALEAMAAGRTVVAADTPDLRSVIRNGETGVLVPPRDAPLTARILLELLRDGGRRAQLGAAARAAAREAYSISKLVRAVQSIYS